MYKAKLINPERSIYDGDTLTNVKIKILDHAAKQDGNSLEIWPNIELHEDGIYAVESIRIYGIDTAEMHPHHKDADGNPRTVANLNIEKELARKAKEALFKLLKKYDFTFWVKEPLNGKYAGRVVAKVLVSDGKETIDVGEYLIQKGLAHPYFGHTKEPWA